MHRAEVSNRSFSRAGCSGNLLPPSPPAEKTTARQDQAGQTSTGDRAGHWQIGNIGCLVCQIGVADVEMRVDKATPRAITVRIEEKYSDSRSINAELVLASHERKIGNELKSVEGPVVVLDARWKLACYVIREREVETV
jgi:hypothetical protein